MEKIHSERMLAMVLLCAIMILYVDVLTPIIIGAKYEHQWC